MTKTALTWVLIALIVGLAGCGQGKKETATAVPTPDPCSAPVQPLIVNENGELAPDSPTLKNDLSCTETEPNGGRFRLNGRFGRAEYHVNTMLDGNKLEGYAWIYPDVIIAVNFLTFPKGKLTADSVEKRAEQAEKLFDLLPGNRGQIKKTSITNILIDGRPGKQFGFEFDPKLVARSVFHDEDSTFYQIVASPQTEDARPTVQKALDSFAFVIR